MAVTYTSTTAFLDSPLSHHFVTALSQQLPLRNVPYRSMSRRSQQQASSSSTTTASSSSSSTIQSLPTRLIPLADELLKAKHKPETRHLVQANLLERPFAHVFLVATTDSDLYRTQIRSEIRAWLNTLKETPTLHATTAEDSAATASTNTEGSSSEDSDGTPEYLIVYITPPSGFATAAGPGYFSQSPGRPGGGGQDSPAASAESPATPLEASTPRSGMSKFLSGSSSTRSASRDPTGGVLDKLKTDFGSGKKADRIVHIARLPGPTATSGSQSLTASHVTDPTIFTPLTASLKTSLSHTFEMAVKSQHIQTQKQRSLRGVAGWNPVTVFGKLECLGNTLESVGLYDDALECFDDLDALYKDCLREGELTFFPSITPTSLAQGQDTLSILSSSAKPYREMILHSSASLWDLKVYLAARRLLLLSKMGRGLAVMRQTMAWLGEMSLMVRTQDLPPHCLASFVFSVCLDVLHHCTALFLSPSGTLASTPPPAGTAQQTLSSTPASDLQRLPLAFHSMTCDLLSMAMAQLDRIGVAFEYLPAQRPLVYYTDAVNKTRETTGIGNRSLLDALSDESSFTQLYTTLTSRIMDAQSRSNKTRARKALVAKLACLDMHKGKFEQAYATFSDLVDGHAQNAARWDGLEAFLLRRQLECHERLGKPKNRQWVAGIVNLLRVGGGSNEVDVDGDADHLAISEPDLFSRLYTASWDFEREVPVSGFAKLSVVVAASHRARNLQDQDGAELSVYVFSSLSQSLDVDDVRFCLVGTQSASQQQHRQLWLTSGAVTLQPGRNEVQLRGYSCAPGKYILDVSQIRLGRVVFQTIAPKALPHGAASSSSSAVPAPTSTVITIPHDGFALTARLEQPKRIALDQARCGDLVIDTGRNRVESATVRVKHHDTRPLMGFAAAEIVDVTASHYHQSTSASTSSSFSSRLEPTPDGLAIQLSALPAHHTIRLRFPLDEPPPSDGSAMQLVIEVEYQSKTEPALSPPSSSSPSPRRTLHTFSELPMALPLGVNVQDFFRLQSLFCKFSISTGGGGALKVQSALLKHAESEDGSSSGDANADADAASASAVTVTSPKGDPSRATVITPRQPASFVFQIQRKQQSDGRSGGGGGGGTSLRLFLTYRTLHEDARVAVERLAQARLRKSYGDDDTIPPFLRPLIIRSLATLVEETLDVPTYALTGGIRFAIASDRAFRAYWADACRSWDVNAKSDVGRAVLKFAREVIDEDCVGCGPVDGGGDDDVENKNDSSTVPLLQSWRVLEIPVEVPQMDIVNRVSLKLIRASPHQPLFVGTPVEAQVTISTTLAWAEHQQQQRRQVESRRPSLSTSPSSSPSPSSASTFASTTESPSATTLTSASGGADTDTDAGSVFQDAMSDVTATGGRKTSANAAVTPAAHANGPSSSSASPQPRRQQRMSYEVQADFENWLVSGAKRGVWTFEHDNDVGGGDAAGVASTHTLTIHLVPLRPGSLTMPTVSVWPLHPAPTSLPVSLAHNDSAATASPYQHLPLPTCETYVENIAERVVVFASSHSSGNASGSGDDDHDAVRGETFWVPDAVVA